MKRLFSHITFVAMLLALATTAKADDKVFDPKTYYSKADGRKAADLKLAMKDIISNHTKLPYGGLWDQYEKVDYIMVNGKKRVFDYYSDAVAYFPEPSTMNKEHTVPQSWWGGGTSQAQGSDLFHVLPSEKNANSAKGALPLGIVTGTVSYPKNGVTNTRMKTGKDKNGKSVFEPCDEYKGDFARIYMYVATCYSDVSWQRQSDLGCVLQKQDYPTFNSQEFIEMLLQWNRQDPVSEWERTRNERVYAVQKNRNPFVDYPSLCEYIWGDSIAYAFSVASDHGTGGGTDVTPDPDPDAQSGSIVVNECTWAAATDATYGTGFTTTANGLTISFFKSNSSVTPVNPSQYGEIRLYDKSVLVISGAEVTQVVVHASSKTNDIIIDGKSYSFSGTTLTWEGSMNPFLATANGQSRITSFDVSVAEPEKPDTVVQPVVPTAVDYFRSVQGLREKALKDALHDLIQPATVLNYGGGQGYTWDGFADIDTTAAGYVRDRYSNQQRRFSGVAAVSGMNIEHIWANSWWGHTVNNAYCDLFNLYPADGEANGRKNNNPIGVVDRNVSYDNGVTRVGKSTSYWADSLITVWEPADQWKGDFARTYFYMATAYQHMTDEWQTSDGLLTVDPTSWRTMRPWVYQLMLDWAADDPVDSIEIRRNKAIFQIQGNRNPYVDCPQLADYVWGNQSGQLFYFDPSSTEPQLFVPVEGADVDFGLQALSLGLHRTLSVRGRNMPGGLSATIEGEGFGMEATQITAEQLTDGCQLPIISTATAPGDYEATLVLKGADGFERRTKLHMNLIDGIPAYAATDIVCGVYVKRFTASWMDMRLGQGEGYTLDVYAKDAEDNAVSLSGYPCQLTDTFAIVDKGLAASRTYYYRVSAADGQLLSNEVEVQMPETTPIFNVGSVKELYFSALPGVASQSQTVKVTATATKSKEIVVSAPAPFEVSGDGEEWSHRLVMEGAGDFYVRLGAVDEEGRYEDELMVSTAGVRDLIVPLSGDVDASKSFFESFEKGSKGSYSVGDLACNAATWTFDNALLASDTNRRDSKSVRMKVGGAVTMLEDKPAGCDSLWFYAGLYGTDTGVQLTVTYSLDSGLSWTPVVEELTLGAWQRYAYKIERDGDIRLSFQALGTANKRLNLDDIQMSDYVRVVGIEDFDFTFSDAQVWVYTLDGRYVGTALPTTRGIYVVRRGTAVTKHLVR